MPTEPGYRYRRSVSTEARHGQQRVVSTRRAPRRKLIGIVVVILLLVPAALLAVRSLWDTATGKAADPEVVAERQETSPSPTLNANDPFDGTPARTFVPAAQGIRLPEATEVGTWAAKDVGTALQGTQAILLLARTAPDTLAGDTTAYLDKLAPSAQKPAGTDIENGTESLGYVTKLAPGYTLAKPIRAAGSLTVKAGALKQLIVTADVVWVYPLAGRLAQGSTGAGTRLIVLHTIESYEWFPEKGFAEEDRGVRPGDGERKVFNADCVRYGQGSLALPLKPVHDPIKGFASLFSPTTPLSQFPASC